MLSSEYLPWIICLLAGISIALLMYGLTRIYFGLHSSFETISEKSSEAVVLKKLLAPLAAVFRGQRERSEFVKTNAGNYEKLLVQAGVFWGGLDAYEVLAAKFIFPIIAILVIFPVGEVAGLQADIVLLVILFFMFMLYMFPDSALKSQAEQRKNLFLKQLPGGLDILKIAAESGLDFHSSIKYLVRIYIPGPIREEMQLYLREMRLGVSSIDGLLNISRRMNVPEAATVFSSLAQAIEMGTSIAEMLASTSSEMRRKRLLSAESEAQKAVVKITFPLLLLILPGIFIVLLAPIIKPMMDAFKNL